MPWPEILAHSFAFLIMAVGLLGVVVPFLPGFPLVWFGVFLSALATDFSRIDIPFLALVGVLTLLTYLLDYWNNRWSLREFRATPFGVFGGVLGGFIGSLFGLVPAFTVGPLLGAVVGEMLTGRDSIYVLETNAVKIIGFVGSSLVKIVIGIVIIGMWGTKLFS